MVKLLFSCVLLVVVSLAILSAQPPSNNVDTRAVRAVVAHYMEARNQKEANKIRSLFTPDADQLVSTGEWRRGLDNVVRGAMASSHHEMSRSSIVIEAIRLVTPDVAIVDGRYKTTAVSGTVRHMWTTLILTRAKGDWKITAIRNMLPAPPASAR